MWQSARGQRMSEHKPLLIELGCEELPPRTLDELALALTKGLSDEFAALNFDFGQARTYASPRRMAAYFSGIPDASPKSRTTLKAVPVRVGWDENKKPTQALIKKAAQLGVAADLFQPDSNGPNANLICSAEIGNEPLAKLLPGIVERALKRLPIAKPMRWGDHDYAFVRPLHWVVILHGDRVIDVEILGIKSGRDSRGHRFHHPQPVNIADADSYIGTLRNAKVLADPVERRERVRAEVERIGSDIGGQPRLRDDLLNEIANLTEWPVAIACQFERDFLRVPQEALIQTMETNQKFVPVFDSNGKLTEHFIGVANIESKNPAEIRKGYERVIRPRFADAKFFYDEDLKTPLIAQLEILKTLTYQQQLGSVWDKSVRVAELSRVIANRVDVDAALATRAASLSKCDLMSRMVGEFPELQGVMGRYYATANRENVEVAQALDEFYRPRFAGDDIAEGKVAQVLAIAERLDTLAGIFAVGQKPSGNKDPFALRRAALGLARTLIEGELELDLEALLREAVELLPEISVAQKSAKPSAKKEEASEKTISASDAKYTLVTDLLDFIFERLRGYYADKGFSSHQFDAVLAVEVETLIDFDRRLRAVAEFSKLPEAQSLAAANKRINNILRQAGGTVAGRVDAALLDTGAEAELYARIESVASATTPLIAQNLYTNTLQLLAGLRSPIDGFFEHVMVMAEDPRKRANRLAMLAQVRRMFLQVADISLLQSA
jgi:glycyl-tRNA synthetase beta chain